MAGPSKNGLIAGLVAILPVNVLESIWGIAVLSRRRAATMKKHHS